ncbi:hypothetical protein BH10ACT7_BH10ACT7_19470 [soil metagenome]
MKLTRALPLLAVTLTATLALTGCFGSVVADSTAAPTSSPSATASESDSPSAPTDGSLAEPGTEASIGENLTYEFFNTDGGSALISATLKSIEPVSAEQLAFLNEQFAQLKGYDVYFLLVEETKISGADVKFNASYTGYKPIDANGTQVQGITLIGWDECSNESFPTEFDTPGTPLVNCFMAAAVPGGNQPEGIMYTGGFEDENPYSDYDGKPLYWFK